MTALELSAFIALWVSAQFAGAITEAEMDALSRLMSEHAAADVDRWQAQSMWALFNAATEGV